MEKPESNNLQTQMTVAVAHQVSIAAALSLAALSHPRGRELLDSYERELLASSIWDLGKSKVPPEVGEAYRIELSKIFGRARRNAGFR